MSDYSDILARLRASLVDSGAAVWGTAELDEALLQALTDMNRAALQEYTVSGLAAAVTTTLPVNEGDWGVPDIKRSGLHRTCIPASYGTYTFSPVTRTLNSLG